MIDNLRAIDSKNSDIDNASREIKAKIDNIKEKNADL